MNKPVKIISLGGGLQSTTLLLISLHGIIERADCAVFADTGWERQATYDNIEKLQDYCKQFDFPIHIVKPDFTIQGQAYNPTHNDFVHMPVFFQRPTGKGRGGQAVRRCTDWVKVKPIQKFMREQFPKGTQFEKWIGFSLDEALRQRKSNLSYITNRAPLIEIRWNRSQCAEWLRENGFGRPSKSSCIGCPYHDNHAWESLTTEERKEAIALDEHLRDLPARSGSEHYLVPKATQDGQGELFDLKAFDEKNDDPTYRVYKKDLQYFLHWLRIPLREYYENLNEYKGTKPLFDLEREGGCGSTCFL